MTLRGLHSKRRHHRCNAQKKLLAKNAISMQEFETTQASYTNAKSAFENAQNTLNDTKLRAPFDGFIQKNMLKTISVYSQDKEWCV